MKHEPNDYVIRVLSSPDEVNAADWNELLSLQPEASPFMRHEYLAALHASGSATPETGWTPRFILLERDGAMVGTCVLYLKAHSHGEYVFDWAWANAYAQHGLSYYPKALVAVPFTPVPGTRLMARTAADRVVLARALIQWCEAEELSSLHLLFASTDDLHACVDAGMMLRHTVQFHWTNTDPAYADFASFLASLSQEKRKKIRQERRKVADAGVSFRWSLGESITTPDWDFFYRCYQRTYLDHGNAPYLSRDFFRRMASTMPENWLLFVAQRQGQPIAASLIAVSAYSTGTRNQNGLEKNEAIAYGRYWGALEQVDCLHFEACYYQPLAWCIAHGYQRFEGGAQGEHKMARALLPVKTTSAHWLAHPAFADAVERFLEREGQGIGQYLDDLGQRSPFRNPTGT
ncbi:MAG: GNAT family N-acetyltransferase [Hydrogenophaga sp.]|uniref:GNAT family N-acetyltransferase n=1 Tax=Hydrogenophaga sp. TaxID=1904254 RepID=UPI002730F918|nr:GNAT family N-acetyltransferase [Hydrogenophaga sp.]MDP2164504.1 GNAT family N-acetyltransferase [Hydrogenophaga sp.]